MSDETKTSLPAPVEDLDARRADALAMGGEERIERHHATGRLTARERIALLLDAGSWTEIGLHALPEIRRDAPSPGDAVITGFGRVNGRKVGVVAIDATVLAGTTAPVNMRKQNRIAEWCGRRGCRSSSCPTTMAAASRICSAGASRRSHSTSAPSCSRPRVAPPSRG